MWGECFPLSRVSQTTAVAGAVLTARELRDSHICTAEYGTLIFQCGENNRLQEICYSPGGSLETYICLSALDYGPSLPLHARKIIVQSWTVATTESVATSAKMKTAGAILRDVSLHDTIGGHAMKPIKLGDRSGHCNLHLWKSEIVRSRAAPCRRDKKKQRTEFPVIHANVLRLG